MTFSIYRASVPVLLRNLRNLKNVLKKGEAFATAKGIDPKELVGASLAPDMYALARQVQVATDMAKGCAGRLAGIEIPSFADTETTFPELYARIDKTIAFIEGVKEAQLAGAEEKQVTIKLRSGEFQFIGADYLLNFVMPNFYFHMTTAYDILRHKGVELSKMDFVGGA